MEDGEDGGPSKSGLYGGVGQLPTLRPAAPPISDTVEALTSVYPSGWGNALSPTPIALVPQSTKIPSDVYYAEGRPIRAGESLFRAQALAQLLLYRALESVGVLLAHLFKSRFESIAPRQSAVLIEALLYVMANPV